jgi:ubiquinone/menaquinone biosynthesis C-methylase UbiE
MTHATPVDHYGTQYGQFATALYAQIRLETFGEDIGQNGWLTAEEQDLFVSWLALEPGDRLLDVACGSGGPTLRVARRTGCAVHGIDLHEQAVREARARATAAGLDVRATFDHVDGSGRLPFPHGSFDAATCIDAVNHLPHRPQIFAEWARVLGAGGRLVFTDPIVVTDPQIRDAFPR